MVQRKYDGAKVKSIPRCYIVVKVKDLEQYAVMSLIP